MPPHGEFATISYELTYQIVDGDKLTVAERDNALTNVMSGIQNDLNSQSISALTSGGKTANGNKKPLL